MFEHETHINRLLVGNCQTMTAELPDERLAEQPLPGVNHPAWILAHLAFSADRVARVLGTDMALPDDWHTRFGPGSKVSPAREDYPSKGELLRAVEQCFARARELATAATPEQLSRTNPNKYLKDQLPTVGDAVAFLLTGHLGLHLGQLSSWRRMIGLAPMF